MAKLKRTLVYPDGFGTFDVEADDEAGLQDGINDIDQQFETHTKAKRNLAELNAAPMDRQRGLYAGAPPTMEEPELLNSGLGGAAEAGGQAWQRGVGRVAGNLAAVPSALDRTIDDAGEFIVGGGLTGAPQPLDPFDGQVVKKGVPLYAGKRILDTPQTDGGPAMLSGVADDLRHGLPEMPSGYSRALAGKNLGQKIMDPTWYGDMLAGNAPQMAVTLGAGALGGKPGAALASGAMMAGDEFQRTQDFEEETGRRAENAGAKALLSGGLQGALDSLVPGSIATGGVKQELGAFIGTVLKEGGTEALQKLISDVISPAETRSFGDRMADPKYLMDLAEEGVAGGIMGGAMHPLGQSGLRPTQPNSQTLKRTPSPADIIEGRDGATGMQPVDMKVPVEKGPSAAVAPNPDRSARVVPVGASVPDGMAALTVEGGLLLYDKSVANPADVRQQTFTPEGLDAFLAQHGTPSASGQPSTTNTAQAAPPPLLVPPVAQTDAEVAELAKQIAARPAPPKALEPEEVAKKIERLVADPRTTPEEREILVAKYGQLTKVVQQRGQEAAVAKEMGPQDEPLDAGLPPPEADPYSDDFYLSEALQAAERSAGRTDRIGAPRPYGEQAGAAPFDAALLEDPPTEIPPAAVAERQRLEEAARAEQAVTQAEPQPSPIEQLLSEVPPEVVAQAVEALAPVAAEAPAPKKEGLAERKARERAAKAAPKPVPKAEPAPVVAEETPVAQAVQQPQPAAKAQPIPAPIADPKAAEQHTPKQLKAAEQLVKLAYHSERTAEGSSQKYAAEREVERAERDARAMGVDVDAISRSVGREPTGSDGDARPTVAKVVPESAEKTPQVTIETSPFMQARRAAEAEAAKKAKPEPKKKAAKPDTPKTVEKKLAAAVAKEKALRAKRDADPENEALLDEYNDATAELYALTKEANGKGVSTLEITKDDDAPSLMKTIPQREARVDAFGKKEPMSREAFSKALEAAKAKLPGIADLVDALDSQADLPSDVAAVANGDRIDGFTQNGRVVVVADGMTSPEHVAATLAHEAVGHLVPESVFGRNEWRKRLDEMMASSTWFRDFVANFGKSEVGSRYKAAELASEAIAFEANKVLDDANYKPPNAYRMFIAKLREWLREAIGARRVIGLSKVLEFSDRDLAAFLARSKRTAETGLPKNRRKGDAKPSFAKASAASPTGTDFEAPDEAGFDTFRRKIQDRMIRLRRLEEAAKKQGRTGTASMYDAEDAAHGRIGSEIEDLRSQFVDPITRLAAKGNITDQEIGDWLYSVHALDRNARGRKLDPAGQISPDPFSGMTDKEAMDNLKRLAPKSNELSDIAEIVYAMLADERRRYVQSGLATQDEVDSWVKSMGPVYVPLKHEEADGVRGAGVGQGFSALRRTVQSAKGRSDIAENPLFHAIKQAETTVVRANKAEVGREFLKFIRENPNKDLWVEDPKIRKKALADDGSGGTKLEWTPDPLFMRDDIINVKENGENVTVQIKDPLTLRAMKMAFAGETTGEIVRGMAMATRTFGSLLTMLNPEFWGTNPIRDVQTAALNVGTAYGLKHAAKVGKVWAKSMRGVAKFIRDPQSQDQYAKLFAEMRKEGATVGWAPFEDAKSIERRIQADMKVLQRGPKDPRTWANTALRYTKNVNEVMENATRLAVYKMATDAGITGRERRALTKNVTVNFNRKGEYGPAFNAFYMFGNVGIQGPVAMASFAKKNPKGFVKVAGAMFALGAANAAVNMMLSDDDDDDGLTAYAELQESTKARNWILGRGMIPMPHGWNVFANAGRYAVEVMSGKKKPVEAAAALAGNTMDSYSPLGQSPTLGQAISPTFSDPIVQHEGNRTAFDSPIRPENLPFGAKKPNSQLKFKSAPEWAVKTAEGLNAMTGGDRVTPGGIDVSPETLQHGVDWATPGLFKFLWSTLVTLPTNLISGKETRVKDIPIVRRFVNAEPPSADRGRFVKAAEDLDTKYSQAKAYSGGKGEADKDLEKYNSLLSGPLRSRSDFEKMRKLYGQLDDVPSTPEIEDLKLRVVRVAGKQYELAKRTDRYVPLDEGLIDDLTDKVDEIAPKPEKADENPGDMVKEALEGR